MGGGADDVLVRLDQLRADGQRLGAAGREEDERRPEVEKPDALVVGRHHPAEDAGPRLPHALEALLVDRGRHYLRLPRQATSARTCVCGRGKFGNRVPGLKSCESVIQTATASGVVGIVTPARIVRLVSSIRFM